MTDETDDIRPIIGDDGVPRCGAECPQSDGKRCRLLGCRPWTVCIPAVALIAKSNKELLAACVALDSGDYSLSACLVLARKAIAKAPSETT